jgi:type I restriction enzyme, S subunit
MTSDLHSYPSYIDSGLPWLGRIPEHWTVHRAKNLFREVDDRSSTGDEELLSVSHLTGVTPRREKKVTMFMAESNVGHKLCQPGDLVINTMWAWMAALGVSARKGLVSPAYGVYRPLSGDLLPGYADRLLRTAIYAAEYTRRSTGVNSSRLRLYPDEFLRIPIIIPSKAEQHGIARFIAHLDQLTSRYVRAKQHLLRLLGEQRQAIVHKAITEGMDPYAARKDSGVQWLGQLPENWQARRLKYLITPIEQGWSPQCDAQ